MNIVFFGTPLFSARILEYLLDNGISVKAVITRTDKPKGRSKIPVATPVKELALSRNIPVYQPVKVSSDEFKATLDSFEADLFVVVAYGEILKQHVLDAPKKGCINLHTSLLPKYRGAAPMQHAIINGEKETGVSIMYMAKKMDAGAIISVAKVPIATDQSLAELEEALIEVGGPELLSVIKRFERSKPDGIEQDEGAVTFAPKIELEDCGIDWSKPAAVIHNLVRGVNPYPGAWCFLTVNGVNKRLKIFKTSLKELNAPAGTLSFDGNQPVVACGVGALTLQDVQLEGKKRMPAADLFRGLPIEEISLL